MSSNLTPVCAYAPENAFDIGVFGHQHVHFSPGSLRHHSQLGTVTRGLSTTTLTHPGILLTRS
jgi:hypothetical protein